MDNNPNDKIYIKIIAYLSFEENITAIIERVINQQGWGTIAHIERSFISVHDVLNKKEAYYVFFKKWNSCNEGARIRQQLQEGKEIDIFWNNIFMWKGVYDDHRKLSNISTVHIFDPYDKSHENISKRRALMRRN